MEADFVKREQELNKREMGIKAKEILAEKGLPKELSSVLKYDTEEELVKALETIERSRGFKKEEQAKANGLPEGFQILENRLESGGHGTSDPIADAFKMKG